AWIKLKCAKRQEFVVIGFSDPKGSRTGFGSLLLGVHDEKGTLHYAGSVGTGFDEKLLRSIKAKLDTLATEEPPIRPVPRGVKGHWIKPKLVAEVAFTEWTGDGRIRHPVFHGLRTDKDPATITRERPSDPPPAPAATSIRVTHGERVIDKSTRLTKLDLVSYYDRVAERMLPHLIGRPATLVRAPSGIDGPRFFQKHADTMQIPGIREMDRALWPKHDPMIEIATREALIGAAQMNVVEFHTANATTKAMDKPDRVVFDLDPGEGIAWEQLVEGAMLTKKMLDLLELESFIKTSGGKGLHIVVPIRPEGGWDEVKDVSEAIVSHLAKTIPQLFVAKSGPSNRVKRIFIDYLRNSFQASTVAAYSARARHGMGVSMPITWRELGAVSGPAQWTIVNAHERLDALAKDPWEGYANVKQSLKKAARRLPR
ncbi:MAG: DNA ligase D, partial [Bacillota bacterium]